jgi:hypothetical protein
VRLRRVQINVCEVEKRTKMGLHCKDRIKNHKKKKKQRVQAKKRTKETVRRL